MISFEKVKFVKGEVEVPADKSITHRSFILSSMANGKSVVYNPLLSRDTLATKSAMEQCGVDFRQIENGFEIVSNGYEEFKEPFDVINCENSGTTARLLCGVFSPMEKYFVLSGDNSLKKRPMRRVVAPLEEMGAFIAGRNDGNNLPMTILPSKMYPARIEAKVKSAQVKSAVILAALQVEGETTYIELVQTRNHTETMLGAYGVGIDVNGLEIKISGIQRLKPAIITVPGDFSSAAFFVGAALMFEGSEVLIKNVGLNPTRTGLLKVLAMLGADIKTEILNDEFEPVGNLFVKHSLLYGGKIEGDIIANIIDEIPLIAALGLFCESPLEIRDAEELRVKESDRISAIVYNLREIGAEVEEYEDGLKVYPLKEINRNGLLKSFDDHRIAMVNILLAKRFGSLKIDDISSIDVSFPDFLERLSKIEGIEC